MEPKLTIAIPTYNRAMKLEECVKCAVRQSVGKPVEILVSDNASSDGTEALMKRLSNEYKISYFRNEENIGPDRNFLSCYERAKGSYVMLLGDDDFLLDGAVDSILECVGKDPVAIYINSSSLKLESPLVYVRPLMEEQGILCFENKDDFFAHIGIYITFMSAMVLRTEYVQNIANKEQYIGTYFIQSHVAFRVMEQEGIYCVNTHNCTAATQNETVGYDVYFVWGRQYHDLLFGTGIESGISPEIIDRMYEKELRGMILGFVMKYRIECPGQKEWRRADMLDCLKDRKIWYLIYFIAMHGPKWFLKLILDIRKRIKIWLGNYE